MIAKYHYMSEDRAMKTTQFLSEVLKMLKGKSSIIMALSRPVPAA